MLLRRLLWLAKTGESFLDGVRIKLAESADIVFNERPRRFVLADQSRRLGGQMVNAGVLDREILLRAPANPSLECELRGGWLAVMRGGRIRLVAVVAVDFAEVVRRLKQHPAAVPGDWPTLPAEALDAAVRDVGWAPRRTYLAVCSPSGFGPQAVGWAAEAARAYAQRGGGLLLVAPRPGGGWILTDPDPDSQMDGGRFWHFLFDPETIPDKIKRIRSAIDEAGLPLAEGGLADRDLAQRLGVQRELVRKVFADECRRRDDLRVRHFGDDEILLRSADLASADRQRANSMLDLLRQLLGLKGQEQKKIELLADKRAMLITRRERLYNQLDELSEREAQLKARGVSAESESAQRRVAGELAQVRRRLAEGNSLAGLLNRQVDVLSAHIHHLTMVVQGRQVELPTVEELTRDAVRAEELIERVKADAEAAESLVEATGGTLASRQEEEILAEFRQARQAKPLPTRREQTRPAAEPDEPAEPDREEPLKE